MAHDALQQQAVQRTNVTLAGLRILLWWAVANITVGALLRVLPGVANNAFWEMTALWNVVNLFLAAGGLRRAKHTAQAASLHGEIASIHRLEKTLLFNAGLDVGYVLLGVLLTQLSVDALQSSLPGWGYAIIVQGLFLFVFDLGFAGRLSRIRFYESILTSVPE